MCRIKNFTTEYRINPIDVDTFAPRFGWEYAEEDGLMQTSYRVIVSDDAEKTAAGIGDIWDSGEVKSAESVSVSYAGAPLKRFGRYCVKVFVNTAKGKAESDVNFFEIACGEENFMPSFRILPYSAEGAAIAFRRDFSLPEGKEAERARAYVCAVGYHEFYFNGNRLGENILNPAQSDYDKLRYINVYDITDFIKEKNGAGLIVSGGWNGIAECAAVFYVKFKDGEEKLISSGKYERGWKARKSPVTFSSVFDGETYDARLEESIKGFSEYNPKWGLTAGWYYAAVKLRPNETRLKVQQLPAIEVTGRIKPVSERTVGEKKIYDFGAELTGRVEIKVCGKSGAKVVMRFAETLSDRGEINVKSMRNAANTDCYILKGEREEVYNPKFSYRGFRYAEITAEGAEVISVIAEKLRTGTRVTGSFECSDEEFNAMHRAAFRTEECNHHSVLTDCPQRDERMQWLNDMTSRLYQTVNNFGMEIFLDKIAEDVTCTMDADGAIKDTAPYYIGGEVADPVSVSYLLLGRFAYERYGDSRLLQKYYPYFKRWTDYLFSKTEEGVLPLGLYGDWVPAIVIEGTETRKNPAVPIPIISTAYLFWHLKEMEFAASVIGNAREEKKYAELASETKKVFNARFYDRENARYCKGVQAMNAIAVSLGLCEESEKPRLINAIVEDVKARGYHMTCGNQSYRHLIAALAENGENEVVYKLLKNDEYPSIGYMLKNGATTIWERWEKDVSEKEDNMHSYCHPMFASYDYWFYEYLAGIKPIAGERGMQTFSVEPQLLSGVKDVRCEYLSLYGKIGVKIKNTDKERVIEITVPPNTRAIVRAFGKEKTLLSGNHVVKG